MKRTRSLRILSVLLGAAVVMAGLVLGPISASAKDQGNKGKGNGNSPKANGKHDNGNHYGWYKKSYQPAPYRAPAPRDYQYYQGQRGYWQRNPSGVQIFIKL